MFLVLYLDIFLSFAADLTPADGVTILHGALRPGPAGVGVTRVRLDHAPTHLLMVSVRE